MDPELQKAGSYLQTLQLSAYRGRGIDPPPPNPVPLAQQFAESREALKDGGAVERTLAEEGGDPLVRARILADMRVALDQYIAATAVAAVEAAHAAAPSPYIEPRHALILQSMRQRVESLGRAAPDLTGRLAEVTGRVLLSTLPTGELNAVSVRARDLPFYLILFDPIFFDILDSFSEFYARAIDGEAALKAAYEYGHSGVDPDLTRVMRGEDRLVVGNCMMALQAFFFRGVPPQRYVPRRAQSEQFATFLRETAGLFVIAHEYGHVLLRHPDPQGAPPNQSRVDKEFAADRIACGIVMAYGESVRSPRDMRFMGTHFFLVAVLLIAAVRRTLETGVACRIADMIATQAPRPEDTHPATSLRLAVINHWLEQTYPPALYRGTQYYAALFIELADRLLLCVQPALLKQAAGRKLVAGWYETRPRIEQDV